MVSRRDVLIGGGRGLAALSLGALWDRTAQAAPPFNATGKAVFLVDSTLPGVERAGEAARHAGVQVIRYSGDVGSAWLDHLAPLWRVRAVPVAGVTGGGAFFCLEQLARDHGLVCTFRSALPWTKATLPENHVYAIAAMALDRAASPVGPFRRFGERAPGEAADRALAWSLRPRAFGGSQPKSGMSDDFTA